MSVSYKKLWEILIDRDIKKKDLCTATSISHASMDKSGKNENIKNRCKIVFENIESEKLRDCLLSMLMNGHICVK